jgi:TatD DNase family protein
MKARVDIHTHNPLKQSLGVLNFRLGIEDKPSSGPFSAGIHPWDAMSCFCHLDELLNQLHKECCVAIGEIGLDKACSVPLALQSEVFVRQLEVAEKRSLPVIIHCVRAYTEVEQILKGVALRGVIFHGFIGSSLLCRQLTKQGYYISFGFNALRSPKTIEALRSCPLNRLFLETDTTTKDIDDLYTEVAKLKDIDIEELTENIYNNYTKLFSL